MVIGLQPEQCLWYSPKVDRDMDLACGWHNPMPSFIDPRTYLHADARGYYSTNCTFADGRKIRRSMMPRHQYSPVASAIRSSISLRMWNIKSAGYQYWWNASLTTSFPLPVSAYVSPPDAKLKYPESARLLVSSGWPSHAAYSALKSSKLKRVIKP